MILLIQGIFWFGIFLLLIFGTFMDSAFRTSVISNYGISQYVRNIITLEITTGGYRKIPKKYTLYKEASTSLKEAKPIAELPSGSIIRIYGRGSSLGNLKWWSVKKFIKGKPVHGYILTPEQDFNILRMMTLGLLEGYKIKGLNDADEFVTKIKTKYAKKITNGIEIVYAKDEMDLLRIRESDEFERLNASCGISLTQLVSSLYYYYFNYSTKTPFCRVGVQCEKYEKQYKSLKCNNTADDDNFDRFILK